MERVNGYEFIRSIGVILNCPSFTLFPAATRFRERRDAGTAGVRRQKLGQIRAPKTFVNL
jgi:hypothetical protein